MGADHESRRLLDSRGGRVVVAAMAGLTVFVVIGLVVLWPGETRSIPALGGTGALRAEVEQVARFQCPLSRRTLCQGVRFRVLDEPSAGVRGEQTLPGTDASPEFAQGQTIRVLRNDSLAGTPAGRSVPPEAQTFVFVDFERRTPLYLLVAVFAILVVALGRAQGLRSLVGLVLSLAVVTQFIVPAILAGQAPLPVALVGALAVMLLTLALAHGVGVKSMAAALGASGTLLVTAILALVFVEVAQITGFASEQSTILQENATFQGRPLSLEGLVLAGMVVGALGVLDDVTVSQASVVLALRRADPRQPLRRLFAEALSVGRDHLSATVNTLVFAYVGAALPILLIFESQATSFGEALNREVVATEVIAMLVGSIGLILAVPLTTALAAWLAVLVPEQALPTDDHGHHHH